MYFQISKLVDDLFRQQLSDWDLARTNYSQLADVRTRTIDFEDYRIKVQFNPERIRSSAAKVDSASLNQRPCFLCKANRPKSQEELNYGDDFLILVNPFPIFDRHLTIPSVSHRQQRIIPDIGSMLRLSESLSEFVVFYNGPECGASAPDHFHFQAGNKGMMPVEEDFMAALHTDRVYSRPDLEIFRWTDYSRTILTLRSDDMSSITEYFIRFYNLFAALQPGKEEPMLNMLSYLEKDSWVLHIMPRKLHRPRQFFADGPGNILLSPASVDLGGVLVTPREEDFLKITREDIEDIFSQVCLGTDEMDSILNKMLL